MFDRIKAWARTLKRDTYAVYLAARSPSTPWYVKVLAAVVAAYAFSPIDLIPDFIPFFGEVDDLFLLLLALQRLTARAGLNVLLDHWAGDPEDLAELNLQQAVIAAAFFLPKSIRRRLKVIGRQ